MKALTFKVLAGDEEVSRAGRPESNLREAGVRGIAAWTSEISSFDAFFFCASEGAAFRAGLAEELDVLLGCFPKNDMRLFCFKFSADFDFEEDMVVVSE